MLGWPKRRFDLAFIFRFNISDICLLMADFTESFCAEGVTTDALRLECSRVISEVLGGVTPESFQDFPAIIFVVNKQDIVNLEEEKLRIVQGTTIYLPELKSDLTVIIISCSTGYGYPELINEIESLVKKL